MHYLMLALLILFSCGFILASRRITEYKNLKLTRHKDSLKGRLYKLDQDLKCRQLEIKDLIRESEELTYAYELSKDLLAIQDFDSAFKVLRERVKRHVEFEDLKFLKAAGPEEDLGYKLFELKATPAPLGFLAIKGLESNNANIFAILANQFSLGLRKIALYKEVQELAITDSLTQAFSRRYCLARFQEEFVRAKKNEANLSFIMIDIDHFKNFNDRFGHLVGDIVLKEVVNIIRDNVRQIDLLGRFGGEEFCVVMPGTDKEGARLAAERIRKAVERAIIKAYDELLKVNISIGVANFPKDAPSSGDLMDKSDWALYRAKQAGRNRVCTYGVYR